LFSWHANFLRINRRKTVVLVNDACDYSVILYGMKKDDFNNFNERVKEGIRKTFEQEGIKASLIEKYLSQFEDFYFTKAKDRSYIARMNNSCKMTKRFADRFSENEVKLKDVLPARIKYIYDYGDNWHHYIETEEIIDDYKSNKPSFLEGAGTAPPEDAGGVGGFSEFMQIINNPDDEDYESMLEWAKIQRFKEYDSEKIKSELESYF